MADAHHDSHDAHAAHVAHDEHDAHDAHDEHDAPDPDESTIKTPMWLPFVGLGLLTLFAVSVFLVLSPNGPTGAAGADADAGAAAPSAAAH